MGDQATSIAFLYNILRRVDLISAVLWCLPKTISLWRLEIQDSVQIYAREIGSRLVSTICRLSCSSIPLQKTMKDSKIKSPEINASTNR